MSETESKPTSKSLAAIIVAYRSLGLFKDKARDAMVELARRKVEGDDFDYETWIDDKIKELPKPDHNPELLNLLSTISMIGSK